MRFSLHPEAEHDIAEATDFYAEQAGRTAAERFLDEVERAIRHLVEYPDLGVPFARSRRMFPLNIFPYALVYRATESGIRILIVRHQHRKPGFGRERS